MRTVFKVFGIVLTFALIGSLLVVGQRRLSAQGPFLVAGPVTETEVVKLQLNHYFTPDRQAHNPDFEWTFTPTEFVLKKAQGPIPADLREQLLPAHTTTNNIRGKWKLDKTGQQLLLTEITAGEKKGKENVTLFIYKTASTIVRIGEPQYVFSVGQ
ncbi:MAG: hypothetical protein AB7G75_34295 [Candidatus Binatia bacterium]